MGLGHFYKHFVKNTRKKAPQGKMWEFFLLDTLKTTFLMESLTQRFIQSGHSLQNQVYCSGTIVILIRLA